ncbi:succinoglycan biosynthesis protein exoi [Agrobacterium tumefaciens]|uniref:sunset domain-containing protein n=1 Tax=Agrobacterium tumefaciens TaxID=358 RepID=UPI0015738258|nr:succinoglycan biosynthesis protein exoi [Agrobacterium tumefaciens]
MRNPRQHWKPKKRNRIDATVKTVPGLLAGALIIGAAGYYGAGDLVAQVASSAKNCNIKGNISISSRERIYHVPGQEYYASTKISPQYGERWFCSEDEARAAGWRRAKN